MNPFGSKSNSMKKVKNKNMYIKEAILKQDKHKYGQ